MILRWLIFFNILLFSVLLPMVRIHAATVTGRVELRDSRDPAVKTRRDFSGVVVALRPTDASVLAKDSPAKASKQAHATPLQHAAILQHATILQKDKLFSPHILAIPVGTFIDFPNADPIFHNAFSSYSGQVFDVGLYPPGSTRSVRFTREGVVRVFCNIHSSMSAMIVVLATPYFAVTRRDGSFELSNVPDGEYELRVIHERATEATLRALARRVKVEGTSAGATSVALPVLEISEAGYLPIPHKNKYGQEYPPDMPDNGTYPSSSRTVTSPRTVTK